MQTIFDTQPNDAYELLQVLPAWQRWYAFDVPMPDAKSGLARQFAMTLWDNRLLRDPHSGTYWYKVPRHEPDGSKKDNRSSLCSALRIAKSQRLPMTGILKESAGKKWCSMKHLFQIAAVAEVEADDAIWLRLVPHDPSDVGCEATTLEIAAARSLQVDQLADLNLAFHARIVESGRDREARRKRLQNAPDFPLRIVVTTTAFDRNPDVVAEVLDRANGTCGYCGAKAPFLRRKSREPYLEVHHKMPLALGGKDTVANAIAACPNCHREKHYG